MTIFGFVVGTTLINTLVLFDLHCTKYTQRFSKWGCTLSVTNRFTGMFVFPFMTLTGLWILGILLPNDITTLIQLYLSGCFWLWFLVINVWSTVNYYKFDVHKRK